MSNISALGFNGEYLDDTLDNYHLGNGYRAYNPTTMQFTAPDDMSPFGRGGINPYMYVSGDPINNSDPSGHFSLSNIINIYNDVSPIQLPTALTGSAIATAVVTTAVFVLLDMATDGLGQALKPEFNAIKDISEEATKMSPLRRFLSGKPYELGGDAHTAKEAGRAFTTGADDIPHPDPLPQDDPRQSSRFFRTSEQVQADINDAYNDAVDHPIRGLRMWHDNTTHYWVPTIKDREKITSSPNGVLSSYLTPQNGWTHRERLSEWVNNNMGLGKWYGTWRDQYIKEQEWGDGVSNLLVYSRPYTGIPNIRF